MPMAPVRETAAGFQFDSRKATAISRSAGTRELLAGGEEERHEPQPVRALEEHCGQPAGQAAGTTIAGMRSTRPGRNSDVRFSRLSLRRSSRRDPVAAGDAGEAVAGHDRVGEPQHDGFGPGRAAPGVALAPAPRADRPS